jgi:hypothetical protein
MMLSAASRCEKITSPPGNLRINQPFTIQTAEVV